MSLHAYYTLKKVMATISKLKVNVVLKTVFKYSQ